jgi:acyl-homoserine-lactone acylase
MRIQSYLRKRIKLFLCVLFFFPLFFKSSAQIAATEILWDNYGVPHIYAKTNKEMYYAFGWAQMNNHANLLLQIYGQARGRAAEYWGNDFVESDKQILVFDLPGKAKEAYEKQTTEFKEYTDAFVKGINDYAKAHPAAIEEKMKQVLPVLPSDVFANILRTMFRFLTANERPATEKLFQPGSNAYAIGPSRSASGNAMLVINPHLPWKKDFTLLFEAHLHSDEISAYGITFVGMPMLFSGFNDNLGWTHTVNTLDASDRYELTLQNDGYLLDGQTMPFDKKTISIKIKQPGGSLLDEKLEIKRSKQGPVVGEKNDKAYAVRVAGLDDYKIFEEYHKMATAKNWKEFENALKMLQIPMFNVIYADKDGNIFYLFNGNVPKRPEGDFVYWRGTIDGKRSNLIWNETLGYDDLPKVLNPPAGFLQNANDPPWLCTWPAVLDPKNFPPYMAPQNMPLRPQRAINMIKNDSSISFDELIGYKLNNGAEAANRFLDDLFNAVNKYPDSTAVKAVAVLQAWDKLTNATSKGAVLFSAWFEKLTPAMYAKRWNRVEPLSTPDGLNDERQAVEFLIQAANEIEKKYGSMDIAWGEVYRFRINEIDLPASGGWQQQGIFMSINYTLDKDNKYQAEGGETFIAVTEFGKNVKAQVLLCYGNATQPGSKHIGDQLGLLSQKKLRTALLTQKDVLNNLEKKEVLKPF